MDANVLQSRLASLTFDEPSFDLGRINAANPAAGRIVGVGTATLIIRKAGVYGLTLRLQRTDAEPLDCLRRLVFANQRLVNMLQLNLNGPSTVSSEPVSFTLQPGLYAVAAAVGCWHDRNAGGTGTLTLLIRHPGEQDLRPATPDEIMRPLTAKP